MFRTMQPAWPVLAGLQLSILVTLLAVGVLQRPAPFSLPEALASLDEPVARAAVAQSIERAQRGPALLDESRVRSFLSLLGQAASMVVSEAILTEQPPQAGVLPVEVRLQLIGDPYDLPIFIDGLFRQRAVEEVRSVSGRSQGRGEGAAFQLVLWYHRPVDASTSWIAATLQEQAPGCEHLEELLSSASILLSWKQFYYRLPKLLTIAQQSRHYFARELALPLISLQNEGTPFFICRAS